MNINADLLMYISIANIPMIKDCLSRGADINYNKGVSWVSNIYIACDLDVLLLLLDNDADPTIKDCLNYDFFDYYNNLLYQKQMMVLGQKEAKFNEIDRWVRQYSSQKFLIEKWPSIYISLKKLNCIDNQIEEEFKYLNDIIDLNLL